MEQIQCATPWYWLTDQGFCRMTTAGGQSTWAALSTWPPEGLARMDCVLSEVWIQRLVERRDRLPWRTRQLWHELGFSLPLYGADVVRTSATSIVAIQVLPNAPKALWRWIPQSAGCRLIPEADWVFAHSPSRWSAATWSSGRYTVAARHHQFGFERVNCWLTEEAHPTRLQQWLFREDLKDLNHLCVGQEGLGASAS